MPRYSIVLIIIISIIFISCKKNDKGQKTRSIPVVKVVTEAPIIMNMQDTVKIYGEIKIRNEAHAASQFEGRLADFTKLPGDRVTKGERIGTVIPAEREALLQVTDDISDSLRDVLNNQIQPIPLYSPIDGIVLSINNHTGDLIQKGEPIMHLGNLSILDVNADLPVKYLPLVKKMKSMKLKFLSYPHNDLKIPIKAVSGTVNQSKQTITIRLELINNRNEFHPGMLVSLYFPTETHNNVITLSRSAIIEEEGVYNVFIVKNNKVEKRKVTVGIFSNNRVEIISGIGLNDVIVSDKAYSLTDGMEVSE